MTATTTIEDLKKWLEATSLSHHKQKSFLKRYKKAGKWTPQLADEFAEIILTGMKKYEEDLVEFTTEINKRNEEIQALNEKIERRYKEGLNKQFEIASEEIKEVDQNAAQIAQVYEDYVHSGNSEEVSDIMGAL